MDGLLRKKDLVEQIGVAKSTIDDGVIEFSVYIPTVKNGAVTFYRPEALDVLRTIHELRELDYSKVHRFWRPVFSKMMRLRSVSARERNVSAAHERSAGNPRHYWNYRM